jgi:hypothetical protein
MSGVISIRAFRLEVTKRLDELMVPRIFHRDPWTNLLGRGCSGISVCHQGREHIVSGLSTGVANKSGSSHLMHRSVRHGGDVDHCIAALGTKRLWGLIHCHKVSVF